MSKKIVFWFAVLLLAACGAQAPTPAPVDVVDPPLATAPSLEEAFPAPEVEVEETATPSFIYCQLPILPLGLEWTKWDGAELEGGMNLDGLEVTFTLEVKDRRIILNGVNDLEPLTEKELRVVPVIVGNYPDGRIELFGPSLYQCDGVLFIAYNYMMGGYFIEPSEGGEQA